MSLAALHAHDEYSLLDGAGTAIQHAVAARDAGYVALANTNHATLAGSLHHMRACREAGILGISGVELFYRPNRKVQGQKEWLKEYWHLTVIAKNMTGWRSLMRLVSESHKSGFYNKACADDELLEKHHEGLICLTGCLGGRLAKSIVKEDHRQAEAWIRQLKRIFGDDLFVEVMPHDIDEQRIANIEAVRIAQRHGIGVVTTLDEHYPTEEWAPTQDVLLMIATNQSVKKREKKREEGEDVYEFSVKTLFHQTEEQILAEYAANHPDLSQQIVDESLRNTLVVAGMCRPFLVDKTEKMPTVSFPGIENNEDYLRRLAYEGLARRGYADDQRYREQVDYELSVIVKLDSVDQILLAWDVVDWAKSDRPVPTRDKKTKELVYDGFKEPMLIGPGRGSAAGSLVCWLINLTNANSIKHRMLFERFMNPDRVGKPDIDIDFSPTDIEMVEEYVKIVHGKDRVVDVIAHSTFGPRAALTDVGRVLDVPYDHVKAATKTIDDQERGKLAELRLVNPAVERFAIDYPKAWTEACRIQGMVARKSEHAGALLILPGPVEEYIPVERTGGMKGKMLSAFGERSGKGNALLSDYGFVGKLDLLRVAELTKQKKAVELIRESTGKHIDLDELPVHDDPYATEPEVMKGFSEGWLVGIFQFGATANKLTRQIKPDNIFDLSAINALIRPGPRGVGLDQAYARRKNGQEEITYWHSVLENYLDFSYGILAFQEQLIEVVHHLGGLSRGQADIFRKIASKLYRDPEYAREVMGEWEVPIKAGMVERGLSIEESDVVWTNLLSFSDYSFNLAHASGYSLLAYRDMWLKIHYPECFYAAFLSCGLSQITKKRVIQKAEAVREARHMGLKILPPDINESGRDYTVVEGGIRLGLQSIKHVGPAACTAIEQHRPFIGQSDVECRVPSRALNVTGRAALIMAGAFDRWGARDIYTEEHIDECERDLLGMSLTSVHSIAAYADAIEGHYWSENDFDEAEDGTRVAVVGEVCGVKEWIDSKGGTMAFVDLVYGPNHYNCTVFASLYDIYKDLINSRRPLLVMGTKNTHKGKAGVRVESLPVTNDEDWIAPIIDLAAWVDMLGDEAEQLAGDSVYPEDLAEASA
jgi:DNA polymerase-3 subunit alpha